MAKRSEDRWERHLARDRERSTAARASAKAVGRPTQYQVTAAIADAMAEIWLSNVDRQQPGDDPVARRAAIAQPVPLNRVAERAVELLVEHKGANEKIAAKLVVARIRPETTPPIRVPKSETPLTTPMTSYS